MSKSRWPVFWLLLALASPVAALDHSHHAPAGGGEAGAWVWLLALVPLLTAFLPAFRRAAPLLLVLLLFQHHSMGALPGTVSHEPPPVCCTLAQSTEPPAPAALAPVAVSLRLRPLPPPPVPAVFSSLVPPIRAPPLPSAA